MVAVALALPVHRAATTAGLKSVMLGTVRQRPERAEIFCFALPMHDEAAINVDRLPGHFAGS